MIYNEKIENKIRGVAESLGDVDEKTMFGSHAFMVNGKLFAATKRDKILCKIEPSRAAEVSKIKGVTPMIMRERVSKTFYFVDNSLIQKDSDFNYWMKLCQESVFSKIKEK